MKRKILLCLVALTACLVMAAGNAWATLYDMYLSDYYNYSGTTRSDLYGLNNGSTSVATIGTIKYGTSTYYNVSDIGWVGSSMYGVGTNAGTTWLLTINRETAAVTAYHSINTFSGIPGITFSNYRSLADNASNIYSTASHSGVFSLMNLTANSYKDLKNITYSGGIYRVSGVGDMTTVNGVLYAAVDLAHVSGNDNITTGGRDFLVTIATDGTVALVATNPNANYLTNALVGLAYSGGNLYGFKTDGNTEYQYLINYTAGTNGAGTILNGVSNGHSLSGAAVPLPPSVWLFGSGLVGLLGLRRFRRS